MTNTPPPPPGFSAPHPRPPQGGRAPLIVAAVLVIAAALLAAAGVTALVVMRGGDGKSDEPGPADTVTATVTRSEPGDATTEQREEAAAAFLREALPQLLGYDYRRLTALESAADRYLAGEIHEQFLRLLDSLRTTAAEARAATVLTITSLRVEAIGGGQLNALVVADQRTTNRSTSTPTTQRVSMEVTLVEEIGAFRITDISTV